MTLPEAINDAHYILDHPEMLVSSTQWRAIVAALLARLESVEANLAWIIDNVTQKHYADPFEREGIRQDAIAMLEGVRKASPGDLAALARFNEKYRNIEVVK